MIADLLEEPQNSIEPDSTRDTRIRNEPILGVGERYILPSRELGPLRKFGWIAVAAGTFVFLFMVSWIGMPLSMGVELIMDGGVAILESQPSLSVASASPACGLHSYCCSAVLLQLVTGRARSLKFATAASSRTKSSLLLSGAGSAS